MRSKPDSSLCDFSPPLYQISYFFISKDYNRCGNKGDLPSPRSAVCLVSNVAMELFAKAGLSKERQ